MTDRETGVFLGAHTAHGYAFEHRLGAESDAVTYILKGPPGLGRDLILDQAVRTARLRGLETVIFRNPADPERKDGIYLPEQRVFVLDGSVSQTVEPKIPGITEHTVDLSRALRPTELARHRREITDRFRKIEELNARAARFLAAAGTMLTDSRYLAAGALDTAKTKRFALTLAKKRLPAANADRPGTETKVFLSAFTGRGPADFTDVLPRFAREILVIRDEYGAAARIVLSVFRQRALDAGLSVITCLCGLHGAEKIDHVIVPELALALCTANRYHEIADFTRRFHLRRFSDAALLRRRKQRLSFNRKAAKELTPGACLLLAEAVKERRLLEECYDAATDRDLLTEIAEDTLKRIFETSTAS